MENKKPLLYLTRDSDGIFLWFGVHKPVLHGKHKRFHALASRIRLPSSWYEELVEMGKVRVFDPDEIMAVCCSQKAVS